ncbi:MAG: hypothetical protein KC425_23065, partial [Anaerolineales bacterium]|nr:hypothetical protein [Anaerolineales bacterium]
PTRGFQVVARYAVGGHVRPLLDVLRQFDPAQTLVAAASMLFGARIAHEAWGMPWVTVHFQPSLFRSVGDPPVLGSLAMPGWLPAGAKRALFSLIDRGIIDPALAPHVNPVRAELGLPPQRRFFGDGLHAPQKSLGLFPAWFAPPQPDWPPQVQLTGFVRYDRAALLGEGEALDAALAAFLAAGEPPLVFTAGSANRHGRAFFETAVAAARLLNRRALLVTQYPEQLPARLPAGVHAAAYVPFSRLLPRAAALIYHGGIGTLAQAAAAAIPQLVMPMSHDQPDNARRLRRLGIGDWLAPRQWRPRAVAAKLEALLGNPAVAARCAEVARQVDFDAGLARACAAIMALAA